MGNLKYVEPLLKEKSYNLSVIVILLVRDPRSMARSRKYLRMVDLWDASKAKKASISQRLMRLVDLTGEKKFGENWSMKSSLERECSEIANSLKFLEQMDSKLRSRVTVLRYEDIAMNITAFMEKMEEKTGLASSNQFLQLIFENENKNADIEELILSKETLYSTKRKKSDADIFAPWYSDLTLSFQEIKDVQDLCSEMMDFFEYPVTTEFASTLSRRISQAREVIQRSKKYTTLY